MYSHCSNWRLLERLVSIDFPRKKIIRSFHKGMCTRACVYVYLRAMRPTAHVTLIQLLLFYWIPRYATFLVRLSLSHTNTHIHTHSHHITSFFLVYMLPLSSLILSDLSCVGMAACCSCWGVSWEHSQATWPVCHRITLLSYHILHVCGHDYFWCVCTQFLPR